MLEEEEIGGVIGFRQRRADVDFEVPEGPLIVAHQFSGGWINDTMRVP
jgi:hypothetical protein